MPYNIEWKEENTFITFSGFVSFEELRGLGPAHYGDIRFDDIKYVILDLSEADLSQISFNQPIIIASVDSVSVSYKPTLKMAFVINNERQRRLCEVYIESSKMFNSSWLYKIFTNTEDAQYWCVQ